jgi:hypothetical protein
VCDLLGLDVCEGGEVLVLLVLSLLQSILNRGDQTNVLTEGLLYGTGIVWI